MSRQQTAFIEPRLLLVIFGALVLEFKQKAR